MKKLKLLTSSLCFGLMLTLSASSLAATPIIEIVIQDHLFYPAEIEIPADTKVKLILINKDDSAEEFESYEMNREKVIPGGSKGVIFIGPLRPGEYPFFGEFFPKTAKGRVIVK